ncbi:MAG: SsrA-binding protein SmpB [Saccharofermentanales bacterium]
MKNKKSNNLLFKNKKVFFDYDIVDKIESGIILTGTEVKSIREGKINMNGSFCIIKDNEIFIKGMDIAIYDEGSMNNHDPKRDRKLLLHKKQINKIKIKLEEKGFTIVPIKLYPNENGIFKIEIGIGKGRKLHNKKEYIKDRESKKELKNY